MLAIHVVHRRLAEIYVKAQKVGYHKLSSIDLMDLAHCLRLNADLIMKHDSLKELSFLAYEMNDTDWLHDISRQIDELEAKYS